MTPNFHTMSDKNLQNPNQNSEVKISKKSLYIGISVGVLLLGAMAYFAFSGGKNENPQVNPSKSDSTAVKIDSANGIKSDSLAMEEEGEYEGEGGYAEYRVVANELTLSNGKILKFNDLVYKDWTKSNEEKSFIYLDDPYQNEATKQNGFWVNDEVIMETHYFQEFKDAFSLPPFSTLPLSIKRTILEADGYSDGKDYKVTQNAARAKNCLALGDFDADGIEDYAIALDATQGQVSRLVIITTNKATKKPYISYAENYDDRLKISSFKKGASIYMNTAEFVKAPIDGVILSNDWGGVALIYDTNSQKYKSYEQVPMEEPSATVEE